MRAHGLPPQIFVDGGMLPGSLPLGHQVGAPAEIPGKMIVGEIDEDEHRSVRVLAREHCRAGVEEKTIGLDRRRRDVLVVETLHAGGGLEAARAHEGAERGIDRERAVTAAP